MIPYEDNQVVEILIEGAPYWVPIIQGSFEPVEVSFDSSLIKGETRTRTGLKAVDRQDGSQIFFWTERLIAVKYSTEEQTASGISPADGRLLP